MVSKHAETGGGDGPRFHEGCLQVCVGIEARPAGLARGDLVSPIVGKLPSRMEKHHGHSLKDTEVHALPLANCYTKGKDDGHGLGNMDCRVDRPNAG